MACPAKLMINNQQLHARYIGLHEDSDVSMSIIPFVLEIFIYTAFNDTFPAPYDVFCVLSTFQLHITKWESSLLYRL